MYTTYVIYAMFIALMIWGGKFAPRKSFHKDSSSLEVTKSLRGLAAVGVILHHISQQDAFQWAGGQGKPGELSIFVNAGFYFVAIFFFCSGFGLIKSLNSKENYFKGFLKKRIVKTILVPFYVNILLFAIYHVIVKTQWHPARWVCNFLGLTLMNDYAWYPIVLSILYLAFYFIFKNVKNRKIAFVLMFLVIFLQGVFFAITGHFAWWAGSKNWWLSPIGFQKAKWWMQERVIWFFGEWWVNSSIAFLVGMIFGQYEEKIRSWFRKVYWLKLLGCVVLFLVACYFSKMAQWKLGYWSEYNGKGAGCMNKFICYLAQLPQVIMFVILIYAVMLVYHVQNPVLRFFGNVSYETYMMNFIPVNVFTFLLYKGKGMATYPVYKAGNYNLAIYAACVIATTIILGLIFKWLNKQACKLIK